MMNKIKIGLCIILLTASCVNDLQTDQEANKVRREALKEIDEHIAKMDALYHRIDSVQAAMIEADEAGNEELYDVLAVVQDSLIEKDYSLDGYWSEKYGEIGEELLDSLYY
jgi:hypothetical protein